MAKILFAWELGAGLGHVTCQRPLALGLRQRGHEVVLAVRDIRSAAAVFGDSSLSFVPCPYKNWQTPRRYRPLMSYAHLLHSVGFDNPNTLAALVAAWRNLFDLVDPALVVFDHSPAALLAARGHRAKRALLGTGFCAPPAIHPLPQLRPWLRADLAKLAKDEDLVLRNANAALEKTNLPRLTTLADMYGQIDANFLTTYEELDHFGPRGDVRYWGVQLSCPGIPPTWPAAAGKKIFAYLKKSPGLPELLGRLKQRGLPTIVYGTWVDDQARRRFASNTLTLEHRPLDIAQVAAQCDLAILNATHGTTAEFLLRGIPILQLPIFVEQDLTARNTAALDAGLKANRKDIRSVAPRLEQLVSSDDYRNAAQRFADKYAKLDAAQLLDEMVAQLEGLVA